jgi:hypothetical protein
MSNSMTSTNAPRLFPATHWSVVLAARGGDEADSLRALEMLCRSYWCTAANYFVEEFAV